MKNPIRILGLLTLLLGLVAFAQSPKDSRSIPLHELNFSPAYSAPNGYSNDKSLLVGPPEVSARAAAYQAAQDEIVKRLLDAAGRVADLQHEMKKVQALHDAAVAEMTAAQESLRALEQQMIEESRSMSK